MTNEGIGINRDTSTICLPEYVFIHFFPVKLISALTNKQIQWSNLTSTAAGVAAIAAGVARAPTTILSPSDEESTWSNWVFTSPISESSFGSILLASSSALYN
ncbi:CFF_collapsed_G0044860.mRNA.1.CDS.1 [Saccharomyces cerevisiae]|nr:CFF_collapsed_G0044860.mRNA.1.CDS.1 [Saccharomyces cerevisiae]